MSTQLAAPTGLIHGMSAATYHADPCRSPSLSSSVARVLLNSSPAHAARIHPKMGGGSGKSTAAMSMGDLFHALVSGSADIVIGDFPDYRTKASRAWRDFALAMRETPVLKNDSDLQVAQDMAQSVRGRAAIGIDNTPFAATSKHEVTAIWQEKNIFCRARYDVLNITEHHADIWDWKTTNDISDRGIERSIARYRYDIQDAFYRRGLEKLLPGYRGRISLIFCFVESSAPYTVRRVVLQPSYLQAANRCVSEAIDTWARCIDANDFPMLAPDTLAVELPAWLDDSDGEISASK